LLSFKHWIGRFFASQRSDPTREWPHSTLPLPAVDLEQRQFGVLQFGDPLEKARYFGKPDSFRAVRNDYCELVYTRCGFQLDFDQNLWAYLAFFISPDPYFPPSEKITFCQPSLLGGPILSGKTHQAELLRWLGSPHLQDSEPEETVLYYQQAGMTFEFELNPKGYLKRWNLFPTQTP